MARVDDTTVKMNTLEVALDTYMIKHGRYPTKGEGLQVLVEQEIMKSIPADGWGGGLEYDYLGPRSFTLKSYGADGKSGGEEWNEDLVIEHLGGHKTLGRSN